jgi:hypothetical protein
MPFFVAPSAGTYGGNLTGNQGFITNTGQDAAPDDNLYNEQTAVATGANNPGFVRSVVGGAPLVVSDLADTVGSSLGLTDRGDINQKFLDFAGMPGLNEVYAYNKGGIELASGIAGILIADKGATKALKALSMAGSAVRAMPFVGRVASLEEQYRRSLATVRMVDKGLARQMAGGLEAYTSEAMALGSTFKGGEFVTTASALSRNQAARQAVGAGIKYGLARNVVTEGLFSLGFNQNSAFFSEDFGDNLAYSALGLGIGAGVDTLIARAAMKKTFLTDQFRQIARGASDPTGVETARLLSAHRIGDVGEDVLSPHEMSASTDVSTSLALQASAATNPQLTQGLVGQAKNALFSRREASANDTWRRAFDETQKTTVQGLGLKGTGFGLSDSSEAAQAAKALLYRDPTAFYLASRVGVATEAGVGRTVDRIAAASKREYNSLQKAVRNGGTGTKTKWIPLDEKGTETAMMRMRQLKAMEQDEAVANLDGTEWVPAEFARAFDQFVEPQMTRKQGVVETKMAGMNFGFTDLGVMVGVAKQDLKPASLGTAMTMYRLADRALRTSAGKLVVPQNPSWFQIDWFREAQKRGREVVWGQMSPDRMAVESLAQKIDAIRELDPTDAKAMWEARIKYNLPQLSSAESARLRTDATPVETLLRGVKSGDDLRKMHPEEVKRILSEARRVEDIHSGVKIQDEAFEGNSFTFGLDESGKPRPAIMAFKRPYKPHEWTREALGDRVAFRKMSQVKALTSGPKATPTTTKLMSNLLANPDYKLVSEMRDLSDASLAGVAGGFSAPQRKSGAWINDLVSKAQRDRENPRLRAASRINEMVKREMLSSYEADTRASGISEALQVLNGPRNGASRLLTNQFITFRGGWNILEDQVFKGEDGFWRFVLDHEDEGNKARYKSMFGTELDEGAPLLTPQGKEMVLDDAGMNFMRASDGPTTANLADKNSLLAAQGLGEIRRVPFYTYPPLPKGKLIGFAFDGYGKQISNATIVADNPQEYARLEAKLFSDPDSPLAKVSGAVIRRREDVSNFMDLWEKAQMDMVNPNRTPIQPGKTNRGGLQGMEIRSNAIEEHIDSMRNSYLEFGSDFLATNFREQLASAKMRAKISTPMAANAESKKDTRGIYDFYIENLMGRSSASSPASPIGNAYRWAEEQIDGILADLSPAARGAGQAVSAKARESKAWDLMTKWSNQLAPWSKDEAARTRFDKVTAELGEHMPYENAQAYIEGITRTARPPELKDLTGALNRFQAAWILRMGETVHAVMNLAGVVNTMPAVIRHMSPLPHEVGNPKAYANRLGFDASIFSTPSGKQIGYLDMGKMLSSSMKKAWSRERHPDWEYMKENGFVSQEVAEFQRQFGAIDDKGKLMAFLTGSPTRAASATNPAMKKAYEKGVVGWLSIISDKSEDFSRSWGHMVGLDLAEKLGITVRESKHAFAHEIANKMIADYNPLNRPAVFQGALGAPIGLFQSYIFNYYERMFRYVEKGDMRALGTQYATQGALFGLVGLPGYQQMNDFMFRNNDGETGPTDQIYKRFDPAVSDVLYGGVLSNIPKLFGGGAVDLYSRGDANIRLPGLNAPPIVSTAEKIMTAVGQGIEAFSSKNPHLSQTQLTSIVANGLPNRPMAGMIEVAFQDGQSVDPLGQLRFQTESMLEDAYRFMGVKSMRQSRELDAYYANKNAQELQAAKREALNRSTRSAIREKDFEAIPDIFAKYVENGGDPREYRKWMTKAYESAEKTNAQRQLDSVISNPSKMEMVQRLLDAEVDIDESESEEQYPYGQPNELEQWRSPDVIQQSEIAPGDPAQGLVSPEVQFMQEPMGGQGY